MNCERIEACPMFALFSRKATLGVWKSLYCETRFQACERLKLFREGKIAPQNLLPNGRFLTGSTQEGEA